MAALQSNLPMLSALAGPRVHVSLELGSCPEGELFMPAVDLTRVLINLVRNAAEAMSIGGRILIAATSVSMPETDPATSRLPGEPPAAAAAVLISIEDNGPGIPLSLLDRIFDLQASSATAEESLRPRMQFRPRGLGLRIVRDFVEAGGGSVRALRLPDRGSRFEIVLPMVTVRVTQVRMEI
jgi:signal transduction histidine kinase